MSFVHAETSDRRQPVGVIVAVACVGVLCGLLSVRSAGVLAAVVSTVVAVFGLLAITRGLCSSEGTATLRRLTAWTLGAFAFHAAIGLLIWNSSRLTAYFGGDALTYQYGAVGLLQHWTSGAAMPALPTGKKGFFYLLAGIYWLLGVHPAAGIVVDGALAAAVVPVLYDATRRLYGPAAARYVPAISTLLPGFLLWGSQLLREAGVYLLIAVCINCAARLRERVTLGPLVILPTAAALLVTWRADVGLLVAGGLVIGLALGGSGRMGTRLAGFGAGALVLALVLGAGLGYGGYHFVTHANLAQLNDIRASSSQGASSGFLPNSNISTPAHAAGYLPLGATYFLLGPFPWQIHGFRQLFGVPDSLAWWFLLPSLWRGVKSTWQSQRSGVLLLVFPAVALAAVLSLLVANFGTTVRERMQVIVVLIPLVALGWSLRPRRSKGSSAPGEAAPEPLQSEVQTLG